MQRVKRPTQADVARLAGVSRATVSYVINGLVSTRVPVSEATRRRVLEAARQLGYVPDANARALRLGNTKALGLIIPDIRNPHFWETVEGVWREARILGYHVLLSSMDLNAEYGKEVFEDLSHRRVDGLILMGSFVEQSKEAQEILRQLRKQHLPIVEISDHFREDHVDQIVADYREATFEAMELLFSLGHRRIGLIYGVARPDLALDRLYPYRESLEAIGIGVDESLIVHCGPTMEDGYQATFLLMEQENPPTAIIAVNDILAMGALRALGDLHLSVPKDVSLVGYDDIPQAKYLVPRLTTASKDAVRIGQEAVRLLLKRIENPELPYEKVVFPSCLVVRESTGPVPER
ncbi:MAG: LacI family DNA-binding transcriptional regulator [Candidatus Caldatribacterium sp.]|nr:LacI family DNA-binding transcriptional regulator [Candidatus Caldatribacterium sp.]